MIKFKFYRLASLNEINLRSPRLYQHQKICTVLLSKATINMWNVVDFVNLHKSHLFISFKYVELTFLNKIVKSTP